MAPRLGKDGITPKRSRLIKGIADSVKKGDNKSVQSIALEAGFGNGSNLNSAGVAASRALSDPKVISALDAALDRAGASLDKSAQVIAAAHKASVVKVFKGEDDQIIYATPLVDHNTRMKAAELNMKARGLLNTQTEGGQVVGVGFFIMRGLKERGIPSNGGELL